MTAYRRLLGLALGLTLTACSTSGGPLRSLPTDLIPSRLSALTIGIEPKADAVWNKKHLPGNALISSGHVYTVRSDQGVEGDIQFAVFKPEVSTADLTDANDVRCARHPKQCSGHKALLGMNGTLGEVNFVRTYYEGQRIYAKDLSSLRMYLWFPLHTNTYVLVVFRRAFTRLSSDAFVHALVDFQNGRAPNAIPLPVPGAPDPEATPTPTPSPATEGTAG